MQAFHGNYSRRVSNFLAKSDDILKEGIVLAGRSVGTFCLEKIMSSSIKPLLAGFGISTGASLLARALPEPRSSLAQWGKATVGAGMDAIGTLVGTGSSDLGNLLNMQIQIQREMQVISMASNIAKSQHEMEMAPVRNMRVG